MVRKPGEFNNTLLPPRLIHKLQIGNCCVQCGRPPVEWYLGYQCCGAKQCRDQLWWVERSHRLAEKLRKRGA